MAPGCVLHLAVQEHSGMNIDLSNEYFELPKQRVANLSPQSCWVTLIPLVCHRFITRGLLCIEFYYSAAYVFVPKQGVL